jgi:hypothetical protein
LFKSFKVFKQFKPLKRFDACLTVIPAKLAAIPPEADQPQAEATDVGAGFKPAPTASTG